MKLILKFFFNGHKSVIIDSDNALVNARLN